MIGGNPVCFRTLRGYPTFKEIGDEPKREEFNIPS